MSVAWQGLQLHCRVAVARQVGSCTAGWQLHGRVADALLRTVASWDNYNIGQGCRNDDEPGINARSIAESGERGERGEQ